MAVKGADSATTHAWDLLSSDQKRGRPQDGCRAQHGKMSKGKAPQVPHLALEEHRLPRRAQGALSAALRAAEPARHQGLRQFSPQEDMGQGPCPDQGVSRPLSGRSRPDSQLEAALTGAACACRAPPARLPTRVCLTRRPFQGRSGTRHRSPPLASRPPRPLQPGHRLRPAARAGRPWPAQAGGVACLAGASQADQLRRAGPAQVQLHLARPAVQRCLLQTCLARLPGGASMLVQHPAG